MLTRRPPHWRGAPLSLLGRARPDVGNLGTKRSIKGEPSPCCRVSPGGPGEDFNFVSDTYPSTAARSASAAARDRGPAAGRACRGCFAGADARRQWVAIFGDRASQLSCEGELFFVGKVKVRRAADMVPRPGRMNRRVRCGPATDLRPAASMRTKEEPGHWGEGRARSRDPIWGDSRMASTPRTSWACVDSATAHWS
jgi:hypothetical protein